MPCRLVTVLETCVPAFVIVSLITVTALRTPLTPDASATAFWIVSMSALISLESWSTASCAFGPDSVSGLPRSSSVEVNSSVELFASSTADVSESLLRPPLWIVLAIDDRDEVQVVIAEQSPSAHSDVDGWSFLPQPAARIAAAATSGRSECA